MPPPVLCEKATRSEVIIPHLLLGRIILPKQRMRAYVVTFDMGASYDGQSGFWKSGKKNTCLAPKLQPGAL